MIDIVVRKNKIINKEVIDNIFENLGLSNNIINELQNDIINGI